MTPFCSTFLFSIYRTKIFKQLTEDERSEAIEALEQVQQRLSHLQSPQPASDAQAAGAEADVAAAATAADAVRPSAPPADEEDSEEAQLLLRITHGVEAYMVPIPDANAASAPEVRLGWCLFLSLSSVDFLLFFPLLDLVNIADTAISTPTGPYPVNSRPCKEETLRLLT